MSRRRLYASTVLTLLLGGPLFLGCCVFSVRGYRGPASDHFDGEQFHNVPRTESRGAPELIKWMSNRERGPWTEHPDAPPGPPPPRSVGTGALRITFVGHATTLIQTDSVNVLTDPIWSERASPFGFAGPRRVRPPGIRFEELPPIDAVVVSHNHYDHMDVTTLKRLQRANPAMEILVGLGNSDFLRGEGLKNLVDLDWWQSTQVKGLEISAVPAQHASNRGFCDQGKTLWASYVVHGAAGRVYFAGDTGFGPHFAASRARYGDMKLALLPIGAYLPEWFMHPVHMNPAQAVQAHQALGAGTSVAIHFGTFPLADDGEQAPEEGLKKALAERKELAFWVLGFGEGRDVP